jgi:multidrug transporter EmrE-like cation transporter
LLDRSRRGLLIPFWVIGVIAGLTLFVDRVQGEWVPLYVMLSIAAPFWFVAFANRKNAWALIPAGVLTIVAFIPLMTTVLTDELMGAGILTMMALPFIVTALYANRNWWAQIPAGIFLSIAAVVLLSGAQGTNSAQTGLVLAVMFTGFALTFGLLWLQRRSVPTAWAQFPAIGLALMALVSFAFGTDAVSFTWPIIIIAVGLFILVRTIRQPSHQ